MLIKPDATAAGATGKIITCVQSRGFVIRAMRMLWLKESQARAFYREHAEKPFYGKLVEFMTGGPITALCLQRNDAVTTLRALVGATDSREAEAGTIRAEFGTDTQANAVHASDSAESAERETSFFFSHFDTG